MTKHISSSAAIRILDLVAGYEKEEVVRHVSMDILRKQVTAIIGPSGCGKSTLIRCINRMHELNPESFSRGSIEVEGQEIFNPSVDPVLLRRQVGMVFQKPNPFPHMSIRENVLSGLHLTGRSKSMDQRHTLERALQQAALWEEVKDRLDARATSLSGGQQQRLCIARSLAVEPDILLMDEPCSALDPIATARIEDLIRELKQRYTIVLVTHNMQQAARASDQTAFLLNGELVELNQTSRLFTSPRDRRTEDYITGKFG